MKQGKNCKIVQDLLPNYIENLTADETNKFVEEHLSECKECRETFEAMSSKLESDGKTVNKKEINYMKKYNKKIVFTVFKTLGFMLLSAVYIYIILVIARFSIINQIVEAQEEYAKSTNYYFEERLTGPIERQVWRKDNIIKAKWKTNTYWVDLDTNKAYCFYDSNPEEKTCMEVDLNVAKSFARLPLDFRILNENETYGWYKLLYALDLTKVIKSTQYNYIECWSIDAFDDPFGFDGYCVDKDTKLIVYSSGGYSYQYRFDNISNEDMKMPDMSEYKLITKEELQKQEEELKEKNRKYEKNTKKVNKIDIIPKKWYN